MNPKVDEYIKKQNNWQNELKLLRSIVLQLPLEEEIKWGAPAYLYKNKNIIGIAAFKNYCGLWFHQGVFLKDEAKLLINAQKDKTKGLRQMHFKSINEIDTTLVKTYILEAIENCEAGKEIKPKKNTSPVTIPKELKVKFKNDESLKQSFLVLTQSCQREYCNYIIEAKREETKLRRLDKIIPMIKEKKGLNDKYKNC